MPQTLRILIVEDSDDDARLLVRALESGGFQTTHLRVDTELAMRDALTTDEWDLVVSDFSMPAFSATAALDVLRQSGLDVPFIIVSGTIGEDTVVDALKAGAQDFLVKGRLARLIPAVRRVLSDAVARQRHAAAEDALRISEERFRTLVESMDDMVFTLDREQRHDGLFGGWPESGPLSAASLTGRTVREALGPADAEVHEAAATRAFEGHRAIYEWALGHSGEIRYYQTSLSPRRGAAGAVVGIVGVHREITESKRVQAQLVSSDRLASVGLLAASVGHEINNPLASLLANLELARRDVDSPDTGVHEALADAHDAAVRIREIARDLRLFSRDSEEHGRIDLHRALESSLRMARTEIRRRARLITGFSEVPAVEGSFSRLGQVFLNLVVNAAQALDEGKAAQNEIRVSTSTDVTGFAVVEIADTGCGIAPEALARVFTPFYTTKPEGVGTGLGLSICKRTVEAMGGEINVSSVMGEGSVFRVRLPPAGASTTTRPPARERTSSAPRRGRVLVVDDERIVAAAVQRCLRGDHDADMTTSAKDALARIAAGERYDIVLCDLMMPEMSGMQLHHEIARIAPDQAERMLFLTGGAFTAEAREFLERVPNRQIDKPFDIGALRALVNDSIK